MKLKPKSYKLKAIHGFTLLEILVGASIITASFLGVLTVFDRLIKSSRQMVELTQAGFLLEEGLEAARIWRDNSWANLGGWPSGTEYYLTWSGSKWATSTVNIYLDGRFERKVKVMNVNRDNTSQDIVLSGGAVDPNTKFVTVSVAWSAPPAGGAATTTKTMSAYFTNLFN